MQTHEQIQNPTRSKYSQAKLSKNICYLINFTKNVSHGRMLKLIKNSMNFGIYE